MPEKDEFTFDDNDDFPETDLSGAFADAEREADDPLPEPEGSETADMFEEPGPAEMPESFGEADEFAEEDLSEPPPSEEPPEGSSRTRVLLLVLLLVAAVGAGAYYFMGLGELTSEAPVKKTSSQVVAVPPPKPATSVVPAAPSAEPVKTPAPDVVPQAANAKPQEASAPVEKVPQTKVEVAVPAPAKPAETMVSATKADAKAVERTPQTAATKTAKTVTPAPTAVGAEGGFTLDAGAFLFAAQRDELEKKIRTLGYEPEISQVKASVRLLRLKVGSYTKGELPAALEKARKIAPDAFSMVHDGQHVVYAGSFADQNNVQQLHARFLEEGIILTEEPVKVEKTLSRIRFGRFTDDASAEAAASKAVSAGIPARVVEP